MENSQLTSSALHRRGPGRCPRAPRTRGSLDQNPGRLRCDTSRSHSDCDARSVPAPPTRRAKKEARSIPREVRAATVEERKYARGGFGGLQLTLRSLPALSKKSSASAAPVAALREEPAAAAPAGEVAPSRAGRRAASRRDRESFIGLVLALAQWGSWSVKNNENPN